MIIWFLDCVIYISDNSEMIIWFSDCVIYISDNSELVILILKTSTYISDKPELVISFLETNTYISDKSELVNLISVSNIYVSSIKKSAFIFQNLQFIFQLFLLYFRKRRLCQRLHQLNLREDHFSECVIYISERVTLILESVSYITVSQF